MKFTGEPTELVVHVTESDVVAAINDRETDRANHSFWHVTGIESKTGLYGSEGAAVKTLTAPSDWSERFMEFCDRYVVVTGGALRPARNCHFFARFMSGDDDPTGDAPVSVVTDTAVVYVPEVELQFGQLAVLGQHNNGYVPDYYAGDDSFVQRAPTAEHSAISLGDSLPDMAIQVTSYNGFLAIDAYDPVRQDYEAFFDRSYGWYAGQMLTDAYTL